MTYYTVWLFTLFSLDRLSKWWAVSRLSETVYHLGPFVSFELTFNRGVTWSLFNFEASHLFWLVTGFVGLLIIGLIFYCLVKSSNNQSIHAELLVLVGAISNFLDRFVYGGVVDFIHLSYKGWSWPIFNLADICVVVGLAWMLLVEVRS